MKPGAYLSCPLVKQPRMPEECVPGLSISLYTPFALYSYYFCISASTLLSFSCPRLYGVFVKPEEYAWEGQPARSYAPLILTLVTTLNMYINPA